MELGAKLTGKTCIKNTPKPQNSNLVLPEDKIRPDNLIQSEVSREELVVMQIGPLKREVPGPAGRSLGPPLPGAQSKVDRIDNNDQANQNHNRNQQLSKNTEDGGDEAHEMPHKHNHTNPPIEPNKEANRKNYTSFQGDYNTNTILKSDEDDTMGLLENFCTDCALTP